MKTVVLYKVVEADPAPGVEGLHSWEVQARQADVSDRQIRLKHPFSSGFGTRFKRDGRNSIGWIFFETPLQAINYFLLAKREEVLSYERRKAEAERAIAWANNEALKP